MHAPRRAVALWLAAAVTIVVLVWADLGGATTGESPDATVPETTVPALLVIPVLAGVALVGLQVLRKRQRAGRRDDTRR